MLVRSGGISDLQRRRFGLYLDLINEELKAKNNVVGVLSKLLSHYISFYHARNSISSGFSNDFLSRAKVLVKALSASSSDPITDVIKLLNSNHKLVDDQSAALLGAFFSVYQQYRVYLSEELLKRIIYQDLWADSVTNYLDDIFVKLTPVSYFDSYYFDLQPDYLRKLLLKVKNHISDDAITRYVNLWRNAKNDTDNKLLGMRGYSRAALIAPMLPNDFVDTLIQDFFKLFSRPDFEANCAVIFILKFKDKIPCIHHDDIGRKIIFWIGGGSYRSASDLLMKLDFIYDAGISQRIFELVQHHAMDENIPAAHRISACKILSKLQGDMPQRKKIVEASILTVYSGGNYHVKLSILKLYLDRGILPDKYEEAISLLFDEYEGNKKVSHPYLTTHFENLRELIPQERRDALVADILANLESDDEDIKNAAFYYFSKLRSYIGIEHHAKTIEKIVHPMDSEVVADRKMAYMRLFRLGYLINLKDETLCLSIVEKLIDRVVDNDILLTPHLCVALKLFHHWIEQRDLESVFNYLLAVILSDKQDVNNKLLAVESISVFLKRISCDDKLFYLNRLKSAKEDNLHAKMVFLIAYDLYVQDLAAHVLHVRSRKRQFNLFTGTLSVVHLPPEEIEQIIGYTKKT